MDDSQLHEPLVDAGRSFHDPEGVAGSDVERHLLELLDLTVGAVVSMDGECRVSLFNEGAERMFGYEASEVLGRDVSMLVPHRLRQRHARLLSEFASGSEQSTMLGRREELVGLRKSGEEFPAQASLSKRTVEGHDMIHVVFRDVSSDLETEVELHEAEARWHRMADELPILFAMVDADERYVFVNRMHETWFGRERDDMVGRPVSDLLGQPTYSEVRPRIRQALDGVRQRFRMEIVPADQGPRILDVMYAPHRSQDGVDGFFVAAVDVTDRARAEERLRRRGEAIRSLHRIGAHPSLTLDEKIDALLELGCRQFELDLGVFARVTEERWTVQRLHPPSATIRRGDAFPLADTLCARVVEASGPVGYQASEADTREERYPAYPDEPLGAYLGVPVRMARETYGVLSFTSARAGHRGAGGFDRDLIRLMAYWLGAEIEREQSFRSQTFLAASGRALAASLDRKEILERLVALAVPTLGDGCVVYLLGDGGRVTRVHGGHLDPELDAVLEDLGAGTIDPDAGPHPVLTALRKGEAIRESWGREGRGRQHALADGGWEGLPPEACASLLVVPIRARRQVLGAIAFFAAEAERYTDMVTTTASEFTTRCASALENASLLEDAENALRTRDEILSFVSHDLGSPLSSISMSLEYVMERWKKQGGGEKMRSYLEGMQEAAERMERLIEDLLAVQTLGDVRAPSGPDVDGGPFVEAGALVEDAVRELRPRFEAGALDFEIAASTDAVVRGDRDRLLRVLVNLLDNAVKFTTPGGRVEVGAAPDEEGMVRFFVSDTGKGIPEERLARIFDRYAHAVEQRRASAGLGLVIVKKTVEMYGGRVWAESERDSGSTFHFTLPRG